MGRRQSREAAFQAIFQVDVGQANPEQAINYTVENSGTKPEDLGFTRELVAGALEHLEEIDRIIASYSKDWQLERLARVDRNIMRLAIYEILYRDDIPASVSVNEAVEMAKVFGGEDSGRFVNGILGRVISMSATSKPEQIESVQRTEL